MNKKISIIVPVYNVEKYLRNCLETLLNQTYKNIEIILVDDGSTDNSSNMCDEYQKKYSKIIKVIHKTNGGLSDARNVGVSKATGDLIMFVDSDDEILLNACESLIKVYSNTKADMICFKNFVIKHDKVEPYSETEKIEILDSNEAYEKYLNTTDISCCAWTKLYTKQLAESVKFPVGVLSEDVATIRKYIYNAEKIVTYDKYLYKYYYRSNSIMNNKKQSHIIDIYNMNRDIYEFELEKFPKYKKIINSKYINTLLKCYAQLYVSEVNDKRQKYLENINQDILKISLRTEMKMKSRIILILFKINKNIARKVILKFSNR